LSYELNDIDPITGETKVVGKSMKNRAVARCDAATIELDGAVRSGATIIECNEIYAIINYVRAGLGSQSFKSIGEYINNNLEKLPVVRRAWAL